MNAMVIVALFAYSAAAVIAIFRSAFRRFYLNSTRGDWFWKQARVASNEEAHRLVWGHVAALILLGTIALLLQSSVV